MIEVLRKTLGNNARYVAGGAVALLLAGGGTATTISLSGNSTPTPATGSTSKVDAPDTETPEVEAPDTEAPDTETATDGGGTRPTDTHGYCVSHAVAAGHLAGSTKAAIAAAKQACPKPGKSGGTHGKSGGTHGKSGGPHGKSGATHP